MGVRAQLQPKIFASKFFGLVLFPGPNSTKKFLFGPKNFKSKQALRPCLVSKFFDFNTKLDSKDSSHDLQTNCRVSFLFSSIFRLCLLPP